jgi:hypothetical protein
MISFPDSVTGDHLPKVQIQFNIRLEQRDTVDPMSGRTTAMAKYQKNKRLQPTRRPWPDLTALLSGRAPTASPFVPCITDSGSMHCIVRRVSADLRSIVWG